MSTFVLLHGAGGSAWVWHLVQPELRARGHEVVAPDLPCGDATLQLEDYADAVVAAVGDRKDLVVVAHSFAGFVAPLVAVRLPVQALIFVAGMPPSPGETPGAWWDTTGYHAATSASAVGKDGGTALDHSSASDDSRARENRNASDDASVSTANDDAYFTYYHDVPRDLAREASARDTSFPSTACVRTPWPLDSFPDVPVRFVLCTKDRLFPPEFLADVVKTRLGVIPDELDAGHFPLLSQPQALAELLHRYTRELRPAPRWADHYDAELRALHQPLGAAVNLAAGDHILDVGCGAGQWTRDLARSAPLGQALGIDLSARLVEQARLGATRDTLPNVAFVRGDAQTHGFDEARFDLLVSRFGTMFFADPITAFTNLARAAKPGARLAMLVWQDEARNEWSTLLRRVLTTAGTVVPSPPPGEDPFSLAEPELVRATLNAAGFVEVFLEDVRAPVYYGADVPSALELVRDMSTVRASLAQSTAASAQRALAKLRDLFSRHLTPEGVAFDARAWLVTARRSPAE